RPLPPLEPVLTPASFSALTLVDAALLPLSVIVVLGWLKAPTSVVATLPPTVGLLLSLVDAAMPPFPPSPVVMLAAGSGSTLAVTPFGPPILTVLAPVPRGPEVVIL